MNHLRLMVLLVGLAGSLPLGASEKLTVAPRVLGSQAAVLASIPPNTTLLASVRVAPLLTQLGLQKHVDRLDPFTSFVRQFGIKLDAIDQVTLVMTGHQPNELIIFLTATDTFPREELKKNLELTTATKHAGKEFFTNAGKNVSCSFVDERTVLIAQNAEAMKACLALDGKRVVPDSLESAMRETSKNHVFLWADLDCVAQPDVFSFPVGMEATFALNVGKNVTAQLVLRGNNPEQVAWSQKALQVFLDMARAQLLLVPAMVGMAELAPAQFPLKNFGIDSMNGLPVKLLQATEKGLQQATPKVDGLNVVVDVTIPMDVVALKLELLGVMKIFRGEGGMFPLIGQTYLAGQTLPSPHYVQQLPPPMDGIFPLQREPVVGTVFQPQPLPPAPMPLPMAVPLPAPSHLIPQPIGVSPTPLPPPTLTPPSTIPPPASLPPATFPTPMWTPVPTTPIPPATLPPPVFPTAPIVPVVAADSIPEVKVAVANTCSTNAHIFEVLPDGTHEFVEMVARGQTSDLKLKIGRRYLAIVAHELAAEKPQLVTFKPERAERIWLLRPKKD